MLDTTDGRLHEKGIKMGLGEGKEGEIALIANWGVLYSAFLEANPCPIEIHISCLPMYRLSRRVVPQGFKIPL